MERLGYIDVAKGICMLLIMLGHCTAGTPLREGSLLIQWIYSFHTMTFFIVTGLLMEHIKEYDRDFKKVFISSFNRLIIPYFIFQSLYVMLKAPSLGLIDALYLLREMFLLVDWQYATWFLITLFLAKIAYIAIRKIPVNPLYIVIPVFIVGLLLPSLSVNLPLPWLYRLMLRSCVAVGFLHIGSMFHRYKRHFYSYRLSFAALALSLAASYINGHVSAYDLYYGNPLLYVLSAVSGTIFVLCLSTHIKSRFLTFYGKESLIALGSHELIISLFPAPSIYNWFPLVLIVSAIMCIYRLIPYMYH